MFVNLGLPDSNYRNFAHIIHLFTLYHSLIIRTEAVRTYQIVQLAHIWAGYNGEIRDKQTIMRKNARLRTTITAPLRIAALWILGVMLLASCTPAARDPVVEQNPTASETQPAVSKTRSPAMTSVSATQETEDPGQLRLYIADDVPQELVDQIEFGEGLTRAESADQADVRLELMADPALEIDTVEWTYALAGPFSERKDGVALDDLLAVWTGKDAVDCEFTLLVSGESHAVFESLWGSSGACVEETATEDMLDLAWSRAKTWVILPFEQLEPRWKVLQVDGISPLDCHFDPAMDPLTAHFAFVPARAGVELPPLPPGNRDPDQMTTLVLTGTTALARHIAARMAEFGPLYPAEDIGDWLREADLLHISSESPLFAGCPPALPVRTEARFCGDPEFVTLFTQLGVDFIELTGNHILDWGPEAFEETLALYEQNGFRLYGGGMDQNSAALPLQIEHNGNRLVLMGCNAAGPPNVWATENQPGAARCDMDALAEQIQYWREQGYMPIVTFQHYEVDDYPPGSAQRVDFQQAAEAGAVIVSGSQSHFPQGFAFSQGSFIHYGLGNLFFDQMEPNYRRAFIDRHVFYQGRHISTELMTTMLEDYARPRPMTVEEREAFLDQVFFEYGW